MQMLRTQAVSTQLTRLKNVWRARREGSKKDVITYGILKHPNDLDREIMLINFYEDSTLDVEKEAINGVLLARVPSILRILFRCLLVLFLDIWCIPLADATRTRRRILAYRALLFKAGFSVSEDISPNTDKLFRQELLKAMSDSGGTKAPDYQQGAAILDG